MENEEKVLLSEHERIKKHFYDEILRNDKLIERLRHENDILLKTALKRAEALGDMQKKITGSFEKKAGRLSAKSSH
jgi:hypothetical protein